MGGGGPATLATDWQGCSNSLCFAGFHVVAILTRSISVSRIHMYINYRLLQTEATMEVYLFNVMKSGILRIIGKVNNSV